MCKKRHIPWNKGLKGKSLSEETKKRISIALRGKRKGGKRKIGYHHTAETKKKIGLNGFHFGMLGKHPSEATKRKISLANKGKKKPLRSKEHRRKISAINLGRHHTKEAKKKISEGLKGIKRSEKFKKNLSNARRGAKGSNWKGGITSKNDTIRNSIEFRLWREAVFARDNWTCQKTGIKGGKLHPHHIKNFSDNPKLRFAIDNGITLSEKSHKKFHKIYGFKNNTLQQLESFLKDKK